MCLTLIINYSYCIILRILNFATNNVFLDKKSKNTTARKQNKSNIKPLAEPGIKTGTSRTQSGRVTSAPPSQLRITIVVKLFNCFNAMGRSVKQFWPTIYWHSIFKKICCCCNGVEYSLNRLSNIKYNMLTIFLNTYFTQQP